MAFVVDDLVYVGLILSAMAAAAQANAAKQSVEVQSEVAANNANDQQKSSAEAERAANEDAAEKLTDRSREAKRQLSQARLLAAEGAGGLRARSDNILSGLTEDSSRIVAGLGNVHSSIRQDINGAQLAARSANVGFVSQGQAIRTRFLTDMAQTGMAAYGTSAKKSSDINTAKNYTADYSLAGSATRTPLRGNQ